jgi:hypothetical protein
MAASNVASSTSQQRVQAPCFAQQHIIVALQACLSSLNDAATLLLTSSRCVFNCLHRNAHFLPQATPLPSSCANFGPYSVAITGSNALLAGCATSPIGSCPFGYTAQFSDTGAITGCSASTDCTGKLSIYDASGNLLGCGSALTCSALYPVSVIALKSGAGAPVGCMAPTATVCPAGFAYSVYVAGAGGARTPLLSECYVSSNGAAACTAVKVFNNIVQQTLIGW